VKLRTKRIKRKLFFHQRMIGTPPMLAQDPSDLLPKIECMKGFATY
jgi:hypothetical protein